MAKTRGVENPVAEDMALIGDTRHELHTKSLPRRSGPNFGLATSGGKGDEERDDTGHGQTCSVDGKM